MPKVLFKYETKRGRIQGCQLGIPENLNYERRYDVQEKEEAQYLIYCSKPDSKSRCKCCFEIGLIDKLIISSFYVSYVNAQEICG